MESDQKTIGMLVEQGRWIARELSEVKQDVKEIKDSHMSFKWKVVGASSIVGFVASLFVEYLRR